jgi:two-component sensor histidine kinase
MHSLSAIYERMNQADVGGHVVARAFVDDIVQPYRTETIAVKVSVPERLTLSHRQAAPLGMLINEAVCNGHKHAFPDGRRGRIDVALRRKATNQLELEVADNGIGYKIDAPTEAPHGLKLMQLQAEQLDGEIKFSHRRGGGARVVAVIPHEFLVSEAAAGEPALAR